VAEPASFGTGGFATTRVFDASRERVWQEWTEPERFMGWGNFFARIDDRLKEAF
jgi:uncharacterized protein YndB with AHSA1/START domain